MKRVRRLLLGLALTAISTGCGGAASGAPPAQHEARATPCGALDDDAAREGAIAGLRDRYAEALAASDGDRSAGGPRAIVDESIECLRSTYLDHPDDASSGLLALEVLAEMRDPRALPALVRALDWRPDATEEHAIRAARALEQLPWGEASREQAIDAASSALLRVEGDRGVDNRMRIELLRFLGSTGDRRATPALVQLALREPGGPDILINRLAFEQLGVLGDPAAIPALIQGLYLFAPSNPALRTNDVAATSLVRVGTASVEPLIATLRGESPEATAIVERYVAAVRAIDPVAAERMSVESILSNEACFALGQLGSRSALDALIAETRATEPDRRTGGAIALVSITREDADSARIREAILAVFARAEPQIAMQLLVAMQHLIDPELLPFFLAQSRPPRRGDEGSPDHRLLASRAYALLANRAEAATLRPVLAREPDEYVREATEEMVEPMLAAADACDAELACWQARLADPDPLVVRKATYMVSRYGRGDGATIDALVARLGADDEEVRGDALYALDHIATSGSPAAVQAIDDLREREEGRAIWHHLEPLALAIQARLALRAR